MDRETTKSSSDATTTAPPPPLDEEADGGHLLSGYVPLKRKSVRSEIRLLRNAFASAEESWRSEVEAYEGTSSSFLAIEDDDDGASAGAGYRPPPPLPAGVPAWMPNPALLTGAYGEEARALAVEMTAKAKEVGSEAAASAFGFPPPPQSRPEGGGMTISVAAVPKRNYPNPSGTVKDPNLFPYHDALYPLLDAYDSLPAPHPSKASNAVGVVRPSSAPVDGRRPQPDPEFPEASVDGYMPNSACAVRTALLPRDRCRQSDVWNSHWRYRRYDALSGDEDDGEDDDADPLQEYVDNWNDYSFLRSWREEIAADAATEGGTEGGGAEWIVGLAGSPADGDGDAADSDDAVRGDPETLAGDGGEIPDLGDDEPIRRFGPQRLPRSKSERADVLLKVLRHATSELQRDHRLGRAALLLLADWKICDDDEDDEKTGGGGVERLRKLLAVVSAEYVHGCLGVCHDDWFRDHQDDFVDGDEAEVEEEDDEGEEGQGGEGPGEPSTITEESHRIEGDDDERVEDVEEDEEEEEDEEDRDDEFEDDDPVDLPNHYCNDWTSFRQTLSLLISDGITHVTSSHAKTLSAYVLMEYDGASNAAAIMDEEFFEGGAADEKAGGGERNRPNGTAAAAMPPPSREESKQKSYLKHNLFYLNAAAAYGETNGAAGAGVVGNDGEADVSRAARDPFRVDVVAAIVAGLGVHAANDRSKIARLKARIDAVAAEGDDGDDGGSETRLELVEALRRAVDSHANCVRALVDVGENTVRRLPPNSLTAMVGGCVVRSLLQAYLDRPSSSSSSDPDEEEGGGTTTTTPSSSDPRRYAYFADDDDAHPPGLRLRTMLDPMRYADAVADASERLGGGRPPFERRRDGEEDDGGARATDVAERTLRSPPPVDVVDVVRSLFLRDLVDVLVAGCGYGDFLVWSKLPVTPLDPMIYDHVSNYPDKAQDQTDGGWGRDEDDDYLTGDALAARYDFTLLMLLREWHKPWTPGSHLSFQTPFRRAVSTLALCAHRHGVPADLVILVNRYLPRNWWPDERKECWCHDCQLSRLSDSIRRKVLAREGGGNGGGGSDAANPPARQQPRLPGTCPPFGAVPPTPKWTKPNSIQTCPGCGIALYCSKEHQKYLWQDGHKRVCGKAPFRVPGVEEERLVGEVFGNEIDVAVPPGVYEAVGNEGADGDGSRGVADDDDGDDSSCWESVDSDDDDEEFAPSAVLPLSRTRIITKFFEKAYRSQEIATGAFANFYTGYHH